MTPRIVREVREFDPSAHFSMDQLLLLDRVSQFAVVAAREAVAQSGIVLDELRGDVAAIVGTAIGGQTTMDDSLRRLYAEGASRLHPFTVPKLMLSAPASQVSMFLGITGPTFAVASACASATHAIGQAFELVRSGKVTAAVTGGTEACIAAGSLKGWEAMRILAPDVCRPFSKNREGIILAEGAAMVVIEDLEHARQRGADVLAEIVGFGMTADAMDLTAPDPGGMARAMSSALNDAQLLPEMVDHVNAHGTGTIANDVAETRAVHRVFGKHAHQLAICSNKSVIGHSLGAAGALELVAVVMAMRHGTLSATVNYLGRDPDCDLDYVPNEPRVRETRVAISNSFAFGGLNAALAVRKFEA